MTNTDADAATAAAELPIAECTAAIRATDFTNPGGPNPRLWTVGVMRHVVDALAGLPVAIVLDKMTGFTMTGVRLVAAFNGGPGRGPRLTVEYRTGDGETQRTHYSLTSVGDTILPLADHKINGAKWRAINSVRTAESDAIAVARAAIEPNGREYGRYEATVSEDGVYVRYEPADRPPAGKSAGGRWSGLVAKGEVVRVGLDLPARSPRA